MAFLQGGSIPYGDVFGESHGYSTVQEFVQYMDEYSITLGVSKTEIAVPLYIFDPHLLREEFTGHYSLPGTTLQSSLYVLPWLAIVVICLVLEHIL